MFPFQAIMIKNFWFLSISYDDEGNGGRRHQCLPFIKIYGSIWFSNFTKKQEDINYFALDLLLLTLIFIAQLVFFITVVILWPMLLLIMLVIGSILQMCKLITIGKVWNWWFYIWTGDNEFAVPSQETRAPEEVPSPSTGLVKTIVARNKGRVLQGDTVLVIETSDHTEHTIFAPCNGYAKHFCYFYMSSEHCLILLILLR